MRNLVVSILIPFIFLFNCNLAIAFDFAPEVGDIAPNFQLEGFNKNITGISILTTKFLIKFRIFLNLLHLI